MGAASGVSAEFLAPQLDNDENGRPAGISTESAGRSYRVSQSDGRGSLLAENDGVRIRTQWTNGSPVQSGRSESDSSEEDCGNESGLREVKTIPSKKTQRRRPRSATGVTVSGMPFHQRNHHRRSRRPSASGSRSSRKKSTVPPPSMSDDIRCLDDSRLCLSEESTGESRGISGVMSGVSDSSECGSSGGSMAEQQQHHQHSYIFRAEVIPERRGHRKSRRKRTSKPARYLGVQSQKTPSSERSSTIEVRTSLSGSSSHSRLPLSTPPGSSASESTSLFGHGTNELHGGDEDEKSVPPVVDDDDVRDSEHSRTFTDRRPEQRKRLEIRELNDKQLCDVWEKILSRWSAESSAIRKERKKKEYHEKQKQQRREHQTDQMREVSTDRFSEPTDTVSEGSRKTVMPVRHSPAVSPVHMSDLESAAKIKVSAFPGGLSAPSSAIVLHSSPSAAHGNGSGCAANAVRSPAIKLLKPSILEHSSKPEVKWSLSEPGSSINHSGLRSADESISPRSRSEDGSTKRLKIAVPNVQGGPHTERMAHISRKGGDSPSSSSASMSHRSATSADRRVPMAMRSEDSSTTSTHRTLRGRTEVSHSEVWAKTLRAARVYARSQPIPGKMRWKVWMRSIGAHNGMRKNPRLYTRLMRSVGECFEHMNAEDKFEELKKEQRIAHDRLRVRQTHMDSTFGICGMEKPMKATRSIFDLPPKKEGDSLRGQQLSERLQYLDDGRLADDESADDKEGSSRMKSKKHGDYHSKSSSLSTMTAAASSMSPARLEAMKTVVKIMRVIKTDATRTFVTQDGARQLQRASKSSSSAMIIERQTMDIGRKSGNGSINSSPSLSSFVMIDVDEAYPAAGRQRSHAKGDGSLAAASAVSAGTSVSSASRSTPTLRPTNASPSPPTDRDHHHGHPRPPLKPAPTMPKKCFNSEVGCPHKCSDRCYSSSSSSSLLGRSGDKTGNKHSVPMKEQKPCYMCSNRHCHSFVVPNNHEDALINSLWRILTAHVIYDSELGYCQGMNYIAAFILITCHGCLTDRVLSNHKDHHHHPSGVDNSDDHHHLSSVQSSNDDCRILGDEVMFNEEECFWMLACVMRRIKSLFINGMPGYMKMKNKLMVACLSEDDELYDYLFRNGLFDLISNAWFLVLFTNPKMNYSLTLRVWDIFMIEKDDRIFLRTALAILLKLKNQITSMKMIQVQSLLQNCSFLNQSNGFDAQECISLALKITSFPKV